MERMNNMQEGLQALMRVSQDLRDALTARDTDAIWAAVEQQEKVLISCLQQRQGNVGRGGAGEATDPEPSGESAETKVLAQRIRRIQQTNRRVAKAFLSAFDQTIQAFGGQGGGGRATAYGRGSAAYGAQPAPVFVHQVG